MARRRVAKKLLGKNYSSYGPIFWVFYLLEKIGRIFYKTIFHLIKLIGFSSYYALFSLFFIPKNLILLIKLIRSQTAKESLWLKIQKRRKRLKHRVSEIAIKLPKVKPLKRGLFFPWKTFRFIFSLTILFFFCLFVYINIFKDLPDPNKLTTRDQIVSTKIFDRNGILLYTIYDGNQNRTLIKLDDIPNSVKQATIAVEDKDFYKHSGFSFKGIIRAIWKFIKYSQLQGGSTITQQLVKNALLTPEKTWQRKIKEIILSIQVELIYSKDQILQMYLNEVPYGGTAYGIEEAAQTYFGKDIKEVNLAEATLLVGLPAGPTKYSPFGNNPKLALVRQHEVLEAMVKEGYVTFNQAEEAKKQKIVLAPQFTNIKAPHFVMYVRDLLEEKYGTKMVEQGGLKVITSLNFNIQTMAQQKVVDEINKLFDMRVTNGAAIVTNPKTGEVLAMVGSRDYFDLANDGNVNVTIMPRQIGSAIKVITYSLALSNGYTPATIISDAPITYKVPGGQDYSPQNYDGKFHGNITLRTALGSSYNIPAVKTLAAFSVNKMIDLAQRMGISTWTDRSRFGLSLTLGAGEVKMTDIAVVYGALANLGMKSDLHPILKVTDYKNRTLFDINTNRNQERVLDPKVAYLITDILKDNQARTPAFGPSSMLVMPNYEVAVKTGTTNDKKDNWTIGYTDDYLTAVWVGNNDDSPMSAVASGITGASPIWHNIMISLLSNNTSANRLFLPPENLIKTKICTVTGTLECDGCPSKEEYFLPGTEPKYHCNSEEVKKIIAEQEKTKQDQLLQDTATVR